MASAVRPLGSLSMARGCARIDAGPDTAKIGSADRVQVHHARLIAVIGVRKTFHTAWTQRRSGGLLDDFIRSASIVGGMLRPRALAVASGDKDVAFWQQPSQVTMQSSRRSW